MSFKQICCGPFAVLILLVGGITAVPSQAGLRDHCIGDQTGCCKRCPSCNHCCNLDAEEVDEEKTCFEVESKEICIPRVVFPWQKKSCRSCDSCSGLGCNACVHNGAKVRRICVLKTKKYNCPKCKYTWTPEENGCDVGCCDAACDDAVNVVTMPSVSKTLQPITSSNPTTQPTWVAQPNLAVPTRIPSPSAQSVQPSLRTPLNGLVPTSVRPWIPRTDQRSVRSVPLPTATTN